MTNPLFSLQIYIICMEKKRKRSLGRGGRGRGGGREGGGGEGEEKGGGGGGEGKRGRERRAGKRFTMGFRVGSVLRMWLGCDLSVEIARIMTFVKIAWKKTLIFHTIFSW